MRELLQEIQRRNVFKVALVYIVAAWLTMQVVDVMLWLQTSAFLTPLHDDPRWADMLELAGF